MADSPGSPLSSHASSEFTEDVKLDDRELSSDALRDIADTRLMPPAKRQRIGMYSYRSTPVPLLEPPPLELPQEYLDISSDTSGDIPNSPPTGPNYPQDDEQLYEQVTVCRWRNCLAGDLLNMDVLVTHIHEEHIGTRQKKYACEWEGCPRIDANHASGYALKAHMRSHTREKPFYCSLPECDRSFTRSDALAKHMRTVHDTEALRPSDPMPRNHSTAQVKPQRLKLIVNAKPPESNGETPHNDSYATKSTGSLSAQRPQTAQSFEYPPDIHFTQEELAMPPDQLFRLLRRQLYWTEEENQELKEELETLEIKRKEEWQAKELVLINVEEGELAAAVNDGRQNMGEILRLKDEFLPPIMIPLSGKIPWYRESKPRVEAEF